MSDMSDLAHRSALSQSTLGKGSLSTNYGPLLEKAVFLKSLKRCYCLIIYKGSVTNYSNYQQMRQAKVNVHHGNFEVILGLHVTSSCPKRHQSLYAKYYWLSPKLFFLITTYITALTVPTIIQKRTLLTIQHLHYNNYITLLTI